MKLDLQNVKCGIFHIVFPKTAYDKESANGYDSF